MARESLAFKSAIRSFKEPCLEALPKEYPPFRVTFLYLVVYLVVFPTR